jgi:hypothetical protein
MEDTTMKVGLLMEAAQAQQKSAESSLRKLKAVTGELAAIVREEVHRALVEELHSLESDTQRACESLRAVRNAASTRVLAWSIGVTLLCSLIPLGIACWIIPSRGEIASLRTRHDQLATKIASLEQQGGRIDLRRCGEGGRLCVRVDRKAPTYGEQSDYLIIRGY